MEMPMMRSKRMKKSTKQLTDIPAEILHQILSKLPTKSLLRVASVCKTLCSLVNHPSLAAMHVQNAAITNDEEPRVMVLTQSKGCFRLIALPALKYDPPNGSTTSQGDKEFACEILTSVAYNLAFVSSGLVCFKQSGSLGDPALLLVNPLTGESLHLPPCQVHHVPECKLKYKEWFGMGFDPITGTHKIICVFGQQLDRLVTQVYALGGSSSSWRTLTSTPPCYLSRDYVSAYGNMHWLIGFSPQHGKAYKNFILSFDFKKEEFEWTPHPNLPDYQDRALYLINWKGPLAIVDVSSGRRFDIWVLKNYDKKLWEKEYSMDIKVSHSLDKKSHPRLCFRGLRAGPVVGAWEHGIFFCENYSSYTNTVFFFDLNHGSIRFVQVGPSHVMIPLDIFSYSASLIPLREEAKTSQNDLFDVGYLFYVGKMQRSIFIRYCKEIDGLRRRTSFCEETFGNGSRTSTPKVEGMGDKVNCS